MASTCPPPTAPQEILMAINMGTQGLSMDSMAEEGPTTSTAPQGGPSMVSILMPSLPDPLASMEETISMEATPGPSMLDSIHAMSAACNMATGLMATVVSVEDIKALTTSM